MLKSRKKILLSSIAMLLVALVALGSATFAWYVTNATVTAETSQFSAASADGLVIRHTTSDPWADKITDLEQASSLSPASINYDTAYANIAGASGKGTSFTDGTLSGGLTGATVENGTSFLVDSFYVASSGASAVDATMTLTASTVSGTYMNIAIYVGGQLKGVYTSDADASSTSKVSKSGTTYSTGGTQALTALNNNEVCTFSATSKDAGNGVKIDIVAFADGYNTKCKNSTANTTDVTVKYSFTAASLIP